MIWVAIGVGWALALILFIGLAVAAADGDRIADRVLNTPEEDEFEMRVAAAMDYSIYGRWSA